MPVSVEEETEKIQSPGEPRNGEPEWLRFVCGEPERIFPERAGGEPFSQQRRFPISPLTQHYDSVM
jgi:hypothetical protein